MGSVTLAVRPKASFRAADEALKPPVEQVAACRLVKVPLTQYVSADSSVSLYHAGPSFRSTVWRLECLAPTTCWGRPKGSKHMRYVPGAADGRAVAKLPFEKTQAVARSAVTASEVASATHSEAK